MLGRPREIDERIPTDEARDFAEQLCKRTGKPAFLTRGENGLIVADETGLYEMTVIVRKKLVDLEIDTGSDEYEAYFETEMGKQKRRAETWLFGKIPDRKYVCFYPMNKRRGEQVNWYALPIEDRRDLMRGHGGIGHRYREQVTQVIGGSIGLDDWEWGVSLYADDALVFKKLVYEMRFDPASALYAEFGPFYVGIRRQPEQLAKLLAGDLKQEGEASPADAP